AIGKELVPEIEGVVLVITSGAKPKWERPAIAIDVPAPTSAQRARLWHAALPEGTAADATYLAAQYPIAPALIYRAADAIRARAGERKIAPEHVEAGMRVVLDDRLGE